MADSKLRIVLTLKDKASKGLGRVNKSLGSLGRAAGTLAKVGLAGVAAGLVGIATASALAVKAAISVESAFAGVAKTTEGLIDNSGQLTKVGAEIKQEFRDLAKEVPLAIEELMGIGELAGQLGVPREALTDFTETIAALAVTTNLTAEEAATDFARLANIFQISAEDIACQPALQRF